MSRNVWWCRVSSAVLLAAGVLLATTTARADNVLVSSQYWEGTRTAGGTPAEMVVTGNWTASPWVELAWDITLDDGVFTYVYTFSREGSKAISHFDIEVSPGFGTGDVLTGSSGEIELGDPFWTGLARDLGKTAGAVLKFDYGAVEVGETWTATYTLVTRRVPIWGDFLAKDGRDGTWTIAYNPGFGTDPTSTTADFTDWIPTPDTSYVVPLPAGALPGLALLGALLLLRRRPARP